MSGKSYENTKVFFFFTMTWPRFVVIAVTTALLWVFYDTRPEVFTFIMTPANKLIGLMPLFTSHEVISFWLSCVITVYVFVVFLFEGIPALWGLRR